MTDSIKYKYIQLCVALTVALFTLSCGSEKAIRKGDQFAAVNEYYEAAEQYKKAYRKIPASEKEKRAVVAWKMGECYRKSNNAVRAVGAYMNAVRYKYPDSLLLRHLADAQLRKGDYKAAAKNYEDYLQKSSDDRLAQVGLQSALQSHPVGHPAPQRLCCQGGHRSRGADEPQNGGLVLDKDDWSKQ